MAATRSFPSPRSVAGILLFEISDSVGESPLIDVNRVIAWRENAAATDLLTRTFHVGLVVKPLEQLVHQPPRHTVALARVNEAKIEERDQQHFPIKLHVRKELPPVNRFMTLEDHVRHIGHVVAVMVLDEDLRPDELRRRNELNAGAEQRRIGCSDEPVLGNVSRDRRHVGDDVDEQLAARYSIEPALVDDLDLEAAPLEIMQELQCIAGL